MDIILKNLLAELKRRLLSKPPLTTVMDLYVAAVLIDLYPRSELPDWVEILANGNPEALPSVIEVALDDINFEEG